MTPAFRFFCVATGAVLLAGCQTRRPLYYWGDYEALLYQAYTKPEKAPSELQIEKLEADIQKATAANLAVHPGLHAHLGYLYYRAGKADQAMKHFAAEKQLYPESERFIETMLGAIKEKQLSDAKTT